MKTIDEREMKKKNKDRKEQVEQKLQRKSES